MKARRLRPFFALILMPVLVMTLLSVALTLHAEQGPPSASVAPPVLGTTVDGGPTVEQIFSIYSYEKTLCQRLAALVSQHAALPNALEAELWKPNASDEKILGVLLDGALRDEPEIRYVRNHLDYFELPIFFHPISGATQISPGFPLQCLLTEKRILELEAFGPSAQAWAARRDLLNDIRDGLSMPWYEGPTELPFFVLSNMLERVKRLFVGREDIANIAEWVTETEALFDQLSEFVNYTEYSHLTKDEQLELKAEHRETLSIWIATLRRGL